MGKLFLLCRHSDWTGASIYFVFPRAEGKIRLQSKCFFHFIFDIEEWDGMGRNNEKKSRSMTVLGQEVRRKFNYRWEIATKERVISTNFLFNILIYCFLICPTWNLLRLPIVTELNSAGMGCVRYNYKLILLAESHFIIITLKCKLLLIQKMYVPLSSVNFLNCFDKITISPNISGSVLFIVMLTLESFYTLIPSELS